MVMQNSTELLIVQAVARPLRPVAINLAAKQWRQHVWSHNGLAKA
jgi:hypothetical protein